MNKPGAAKTLAVIGSRGFSVDVVPFAMDSYLYGVSRIVSGGARGVDRAAEEYGRKLGLEVLSYRPRRCFAAPGFFVETYANGKFVGAVVGQDQKPIIFDTFAQAAKRRNWWIVRDATHVLALWDGESSGTAHGIAAASRFGRELRIWMEGDS